MPPSWNLFAYAYTHSNAETDTNYQEADVPKATPTLSGQR
jgi:hypothetical protein